MKSFVRLSLIALLVALLVWPCSTIFASDFIMTIECKPQTVDINGSSTVLISLKDSKDRPIPGQNIFVGVTGIKGSFTLEMLTTNSEGLATTTFYPSELGMGYIISKANIRKGSSIVFITAETTISVGNLNSDPVAKITSAVPNPVQVGQQIRFTGTGEDADGEIIEWKWDMGDGTVFTGIDYSSEVTHIYEKPGDFKVTFMVKDDSETWSNPSWVTIKSYFNKKPVITPVGEWESSLLADQEITVEAMITDSDSNLIKCVFDWDDGNTEEFKIIGGSAKLKAKHEYSDTGIYYLKIKAYDANDSETIFPEEGWKINVYGKSKGGVKILFPGFAGEHVDFIGPFPSRNVALTKMLEDWGVDAGFTLLPGKYQLLSSNRKSAIRPLKGDITVRPFKTSEVECIRWTPKLASHIFARGKNPAKIVCKFYDTEGDIRKPALINLSGDKNNGGVYFTANTGSFIIPIASSKQNSLKVNYVIEGVIGEKIINIPNILPRIDLTTKPLVDNTIQLVVDTIGVDGKIKLNTSVFSVITGRRLESTEIEKCIPEECSPGITNLKIDQFDSYKYAIRIDASYTSGNITSTDHTSFVPYIGDQKLHLSWGYSEDEIIMSGYLTSKESGEILTDQKFCLCRDGKHFGNVSSKNGVFFERKKVSEILSGTNKEALELKISTMSGGLTFEDSIIVRHYDRHPRLSIKNSEKGLSFAASDIDENPIPGLWISAQFVSNDMVLTDQKQLESLGYPDSSVRTSINGFARLGFDSEDFDDLSVLVKTEINGYPILKLFKIK